MKPDTSPERAADKSAHATTESTTRQPEPSDRVGSTRHRARIGGKTLAYTATCGTWVLREEDEKDGEHQGQRARAEMFFTAYTLDGVRDVSARPITFCFNGGPGSSSVWLHLGLFGPKRVDLDKDGRAGPPPYRLVDNEHSLLTHSDLVFIDPVGTGFSRMVAGEKTKEFHEYQRDLESVGAFIRLYLSRHARWASPKFIGGESYGTTRACGLAGLLQDKYALYLNGLLLISCALEFQTIRFEAGNDLPPTLYLPTYAATAWFHKKLAPDLQRMKLPALLKEVEAFAAGPYAQALFAGDRLDARSTEAIARAVARFTGLTKEYVLATKLRINIHRFCKELLRGEGKTVGRLDARFTGHDRDSAGEHFEFDPAHAVIGGAFSACLNDYVRRELKFESDLDYRVLSQLYLSWGWKDFVNKFANIGETLRQAMSKNPHLKVYVGNGIYDFATPHFASDYTMSHLSLPESLIGNLTTHYYEAGHMMYIHQPSLAAQGKHLRTFVEKAVRRST